MKKTYYEVIKFATRGNICRATMDYIQGDLLFDLVKRDTYISKEELFYWFSSLITQLIQYHKYSKNRCYHYLYPFSVCISRDSELYLLDLEATSNDFALKNIQTRSMRQHFIKTSNHASKENRISQDLYGLGKTMQFVLAHSIVMPELTRREASKLHSIISRCIGEDSKKQYYDLGHVQKDSKFLKQKGKQINSFTHNKKAIKLALITSMLTIGVITAKALMSGEAELEGIESGGGNLKSNNTKIEDVEKELVESEREINHNEHENYNDKEEETREVNINKDVKEAKEVGINRDVNEAIVEMEGAIGELASFLHENNSITNQRVISRGGEMEVNLLRALAMAYDREGFYNEGIKAYARLVEIEVRDEHKEMAFIRKMKMETEGGLFEQALETGRLGLEQMDYAIDIVKIYLEIMVESGFYNAQEIIKEYDRICIINPKTEADSYVVKLLGELEY